MGLMLWLFGTLTVSFLAGVATGWFIWAGGNDGTD